jgi:anaerobic selenocysteine-containing dehydrogenase
MSKSDTFRWGRSTVETACPLDCPDSCSLAVTVENGRVVEIDGAGKTPEDSGYICAKVRRFADRVYGESRLLHPAVRTGPKGRGTFKRVSWDDALGAIASKLTAVRDEFGGEAILPFAYGGSNGLLSDNTTDAELFRALGSSRLARTVCAAATGAAHQAMYGRMPGVAYADYLHAGLIVVWGANPSTSGIHLVPVIRKAQKAGAKLVVVDPRQTNLARVADLHLALRPGTDVVVALALHRFLFEEGHADWHFLAGQAEGIDALRARAREWTFDRAGSVAGLEPDLLRRVAELYAACSPAVIRCGWGLERNRNGGSAVMAVLALPAVAGKFGVRGGGFTMSNSSAWALSSASWIGTPEPATRVVNMSRLGRALVEEQRPPIKALFVYNANPAATVPDQNAVLRGLAREDLFTVVFEQVMTDTALYADVLLPATTFLETYDIVRGYGNYALQLARPVIDAVGEARPNVEVFSELAQRLGFRSDMETEGEALLRVAAAMPESLSAPLLAGDIPEPPSGSRPVQFVDVRPATPNGKVRLFPEELEAAAPAGLYGYQPDPATASYPLALISPASDKTISSTMGELRVRPGTLFMHPDDATAREIEEGDVVRVFNGLGEVHCPVTLGTQIAPGTISLPKGLWRRSTLNESTGTALVPDTLTDLGGGACFNDARVEVVRVLPTTFEGRRLSLWVSPKNRKSVN